VNETNSNQTALTETDLLFRRADEELVGFDAQQIAEALVREAHLTPEIAQQISIEVRDQVLRAGIRGLSSSLIRGMVDSKLIEYGLIAALRAHTRLGVPAFDVDRLIQSAAETATPHGPEGTSLALAEAIKREYAMISVFSENVVEAHLAGDLHLENLGEVDRPTSLTGSVDFIKKQGIKLPGGFAGSRPARRPEVLAAHLVKYTAALHGYFSEPLAWDAVNFAMAPLLTGLGTVELKQLAQAFLFELSAPAIARGGQPVRCDLHLDWEAPGYLAQQTAVGAGGEPCNANYDAYTETARAFLKSLFEVFLEGDGEGLGFSGPRPIFRLTPRAAEDEDLQAFLELVGRVAVERGGLVIAFDRSSRDGGAAAFTNRYGLNADKLHRVGESWRWRAATLSSVAINLPRLGYQARGDHVKVFELISGLLELAAQASLEKRVFLEKLIARGEGGSLALLAMRPGREPFLPLTWTSHAICPIGLFELVRVVTGEGFDESAAGRDFAGRIIAHLTSEVRRLSAKHKVHFLLAESRSGAAGHRLARLDLNVFGQAAAQLRDGDVEARPDEVSYTNSLKLPLSSDATAIERLTIEGALGSNEIWGATTELWLGRTAPPSARFVDFVFRVLRETTTPSVTFAPEFSICAVCHAVWPGLSSTCPQCASARVDGLAQATTRYSRTSSWPSWKLAELKRRRRMSDW
jgi:ribonucleoside-triphosphate reductase (formate)